MKKVRILVVKNPITALFMAAWFRQNNCEDAVDWRTVPVHTAPALLNGIENFKTKKLIYVQSCHDVIRTISDEWLVCRADKYESGFDLSAASLKAVFKERERRQENLARIRKTLTDANIPLNAVKEIWIGNNGYGNNFSFLCPQAKVLQFEHGLSDVRNAIKHQQEPKLRWWPYPHRKMRRNISKWLYDRLLIFDLMVGKCDQRVSLLGDEIRLANASCPVETINSTFVHQIVKSVMKTDPSHYISETAQGSTALILLDNVKPWAKTEADQMSFFDSFEQHIVNQYSDVFLKHGIRNLVFKSRFFHEEFSKEGFSNFSRLKRNYRLLFLTDYSVRNFPVEFYLEILRPTLILGSYSSGLFYSKKLFPATTCSYHQWFVNYCMNSYNKTHADFAWLENLFHEQYAVAFNQIHPVLESQIV
jgi:hypothetical protein